MDIMDVINSLEDMISTGGASAEEILQAEKELGVAFSEEYKKILAEFGSVLAEEIELVGLAKSQNRNTVVVTKREWEYNPLVPRHLYVVENLGIEGVIIWQDEHGTIYQSSSNKEPEKVYSSLEEYIKSVK